MLMVDCRTSPLFYCLAGLRLQSRLCLSGKGYHSQQCDFREEFKAFSNVSLSPCPADDMQMSAVVASPDYIIRTMITKLQSLKSGTN
jgi:hypothetical protein